ncbi:prephenate dehydrogenase [Arcanobacterium hippocoleae]|uniref:Prephenate dehydrogenase n=1 Tax=Arcanobacterium hippocoleae TaxID=149017 RepID=A0ABU1T082_9ACTO|nr:prephenate dehydrogenase [Arcanobacterium hippocoleae]MDR6938784.1 prephenate dehydrogenase [Arcanobacterium hippocoleae]
MSGSKVAQNNYEVGKMTISSLLLTPSPVLIIGAGLLGTSIALRLRQGGVEVYLADVSPIAARLAQDLGAGKATAVAAPKLVIVAVPPDVTPAVVADALEKYPKAIVTDVSSVKQLVIDLIAVHPCANRFVGSHPMAGRERSGAIAADADLFAGRPWVIVPHEKSGRTAQRVVQNLAVDMGGSVIQMSAQEHDHAVSLVSHLPQIMSSLVAGQLTGETADSLQLAGQGLRDVTRIAKSDSLLWTSIINANRKEIAAALRRTRKELDDFIKAVESDGDLSTISRLIALGNEGVSRIPGKHGGAPTRYTEVTVLIPDQPGQMGRLFTEIGQIGVNIEDFTLEHSVGQPVGRAVLSVIPAHTRELEIGLIQRGWQVISVGEEQR